MSEQAKTPRLTADEIGQIRAYAAGDTDHIPYDLQRDGGIWGAVKLLCEMAAESLELAAVRAELEEARRELAAATDALRDHAEHSASCLQAATNHLRRAEAAESALAERKADGKRLDWVLPILSGDSGDVADRRTLALGAALLKGLDGKSAIDEARKHAE